MLLARRFAKLTVLSLSVVLLTDSRCPAADAEGKAEKQKQQGAPKIRIIQKGRIQGQVQQGAPVRVLQGGFPGRFAGGLNAGYLLRRPEVQKELKITDDQKAKIDAINAEQAKASREMYAGMNWREMTPEERQKKSAEFREKRTKLDAEMQKKIDAVLTAEQRKRLSEIVIQQKGIYALTDETVAKDLGLSSDQKAKIKAAFESRQEKYRAVYKDVQDGKIDRNKMRDKYAEIQKEIESTALGVLTGAQKKKFEEMKGEKFELKQRQFQVQPGRKGNLRKLRPGDEV